ncbi:MAG: PadR family transcriptional regulator [Nitrososphaerota archaeon]|nr:PadR family transcriptional regulator [Nitrososphaerota archaeon]
MASNDLRSAIIRILKDDEMSGYSIHKTLLMKGFKTWPNHVYTLLSQMEKDSRLLRSKWVVDKRKKNSPRRHLYSLSEAGNQEYENIVKDSLVVLMERFFKENISMEDLSFHMGLVREILGTRAKWSRNDSFRLVIASPTYHPLVCFPKFYYAVSEAYPNSSVYVVKNPWENGRSLENTKNLTFLDGSRDEIPLRDGFADYVLLQGFPKKSSVQTTVGESLRVLKDDVGCLFLDIPSIMSVEKRIPHNTIFPEYVLKLFYEMIGQDRSVRIEEVTRILSTSFEQVRNCEVNGRVSIFAAKKRTGSATLEMRPATTRSSAKVVATAQ